MQPTPSFFLADMALTAAAQRAAEHLRGASGLLVTCGAGFGVDSGLPDFRGKEGLWQAYPPLAKRGLSFEEMADPQWFVECVILSRNSVHTICFSCVALCRDPQFAWGFYGHRLNLYRETQPHKGFQILQEWSGQMSRGSFVFTTNVDGHFQKAGFSAGRICEVHGSIHHIQAADPATVIHEWQMAGAGVEQHPKDMKVVHSLYNVPLVATADHLQLEVDMDALRVSSESLPMWPSPNGGPSAGVARPNIKMFCDESFVVGRQAHQVTAFKEWVAHAAAEGGLVVLDAGSGTSVPVARITAEQVAGHLKAPLIRINPREAHIEAAAIPADRAVSMQCTALEGLSLIDECMQ